MGFEVGSRNTKASAFECLLPLEDCNSLPQLVHPTAKNLRSFVFSCPYSVALLLLLAIPGLTKSRDDLSVDQLKARVSVASVPDKVHICVQIAEKQLDLSKKLYEAGDIANAQAPLTDVVAFSELARDYSIQSNKHQKQTEISVRAMTRKLNNVLHLLGKEDQPPVQDAISRLERVRDDLLGSMFPKGVK